MCRKGKQTRELYVRKQEREYLEKLTMLSLRKQHPSSSPKVQWYWLFSTFLRHALLLAVAHTFASAQVLAQDSSLSGEPQWPFQEPRLSQRVKHNHLCRKNPVGFSRFLKGPLKLQTKDTCMLWLHTFPPGPNANPRNMITCRAP